jgi:L-serine dehydratase
MKGRVFKAEGGEAPGLPILGDNAPPSLPSIFNDVIGPVMRGPSSSHCAAAVRIGRLARDLMGGQPDEVLVEFHPSGSLATTHKTQGSDMGLFGGLLGWEASDHRLVDSERAIREAGVSVDVRITEFQAFHPNTYRMTLRRGGSEHRMTAVSTGGGIIRTEEIDGFPVKLAGDFEETLVFVGEGGDLEALRALADELKDGVGADEVILHSSDQVSLIQIKSQEVLPSDVLEDSLGGVAIEEVRHLHPVLPVKSRAGMEVPFLSASEMEGSAPDDSTNLWEMAAAYESARGGIDQDEVVVRMMDIVRIMEASVAEGLAGTEYHDRILPPQAGRFRDHLERGMLLEAGMLNRMILYVSAIMEVKSSMGVVVAAPTAGSCGALPGTVIGAGHFLGSTTEEMAKAMLAAGIIGVFITAGSTFAAEVCGCQAECGAGSGMAAAALVTLRGGSRRQAVAAASMALQNTLGMICDPVANRVEVPCLGRNVLAAGNALSCANMALAGFHEVIPLDEVIQAMDQVGKAMPHELRCTALGGLSISETSKRIQKELEQTGQ